MMALKHLWQSKEHRALLVAFAVGVFLITTADKTPKQEPSKQAIATTGSYHFQEATVIEDPLGRQYLTDNKVKVALNPNTVISTGSVWGDVVVVNGVIKERILLEGAGGSICHTQLRHVYTTVFSREQLTGTYKPIRC